MNLLKTWGVALLTIALMISLFAIPAFAEETTATTAATTAETTAATTAATTAETTAATTAASTEAATTAETTAVATTAPAEEEEEGMKTTTLVSLIFVGVLLIVAVVLGIKFQDKVKKFLRVLKSESKKIVWLPWDQTKKNTWVVLVVLVLCALAICLIDFGLSKGILAFINLFNK